MGGYVAIYDYLPEKVPEKIPGPCVVKLSILAPAFVDGCDEELEGGF